MKLKTHVVALFCLVFAVTGCVPTAELYIGKPVTSAPVVRLQEDVNSAAGTWQTFDVTINYIYAMDGGLLDLKGQGELSQHYQMLYNDIRTMRVYLFFLDADGVVLKTIEIPVFLSSTEDQFTFNIPFKVSETIKSFSFGYSGVVQDMDGQSSFYNLP